MLSPMIAAVAARAMTISMLSFPRLATITGGDERGLARHRDAHGLDRDQREEQRVADVLGDVHERRPSTSRFYHAAVPALHDLRPRSRLARARGRAAHGPRRGPHARLRPARDQGDGRGLQPPRSPRWATTSCSATRSTCSLIRATSCIARFGGLHEFMGWAARSSPTPAASRSSRWATGRWPTRSRAAAARRAAPRRRARHRRGRRALPLATSTAPSASWRPRPRWRSRPR